MYLLTLFLCDIELVEMAAAYKLYVLHTFCETWTIRKFQMFLLRVVSTTGLFGMKNTEKDENTGRGKKCSGQTVDWKA